MSREKSFNRFIRLGSWTFNTAQIGVRVPASDKCPTGIEGPINASQPKFQSHWVGQKTRYYPYGAARRTEGRRLFLPWGVPCYACILMWRFLETEKWNPQELLEWSFSRSYAEGERGLLGGGPNLSPKCLQCFPPAPTPRPCSPHLKFISFFPSTLVLLLLFFNP